MDKESVDLDYIWELNETRRIKETAGGTSTKKDCVAVKIGI